MTSSSPPTRQARVWFITRPGFAAAGVALVAQYLLHEAVVGVPFAPYALGNRLIRLAPGSVATEAIERLGHHALPLIAWALIGGALAMGALLSRRTPTTFGALAFALSMLAARLDPVPHTLVRAIEASVCAGLAAGLAAWVISPRPTSHSIEEALGVDPRRRRLLRMILLGGGLIALGSFAVTRRLSRDGPREPVLSDTGVTTASDPEFDAIPGISPLITSSEEHYVVDINLDDPILDSNSWRLTVKGAAAAPVTYTLEDLQAMHTVEEPVVMQCISNTVGGSLVGNARWIGVPLSSLLAAAQPDPGARIAIARAADGYSETIPLLGGIADRVIVAFAMDGSLLPNNPGFPARLIFPGRYGMRSVKWLTEIEISAADGEGYWEKRGWDREAVMRTASRIDVPGHRSVTASPVQMAGLAWAGDRQIDAVEVSADDGATWMPAELEREVAPLAWRRWRAEVALAPGVYALLVRAYDGTGAMQEEERRSPHPSGASGYHRVVITVR